LFSMTRRSTTGRLDEAVDCSEADLCPEERRLLWSMNVIQAVSVTMSGYRTSPGPPPDGVPEMRCKLFAKSIYVVSIRMN
jgi:hypothetical protein